MATSNQKTALVTGGNRGIGKEICRQLAEQGFQVFLACRDKKKGLSATNGMRGNVQVIEMDVSDEQSIVSAYQEVSQQVKQLDVLINNAAILIASSHSLLDVPKGDIDQTLQVNLLGPWLVSRVFAPLLQTGSRIIMISSGAGQMAKGIGGYAPLYSFSKSTLNALTQHLAFAFKGQGVVVNAVGPGWVRTDMGGAGATRSVEKGAETPVWLATEAPVSINGQFIRDKQVDGW